MISVTAAGKKGAVPQRLNQKIKSATELVDLSPEGTRLLEATRKAVAKVITVAPRGSDVTVVITLVEGPFGGWSASCLIDVEEARGS